MTGAPPDDSREARTRRRRVVTLLVFLGIVLFLIFAFRAVLTPFLVAVFAAYLIDPVVDRLADVRLFRRVRIGRAGAVLAIYVVFLTGVFIAARFAVPALVGQIEQVRADLPRLQRGAEEFVQHVVELVRGDDAAEEATPGRLPAAPDVKRVRLRLRGGGAIEGDVLARANDAVVLDVGERTEVVKTSEIDGEERLQRARVALKDGEVLLGQVIAERHGVLVVDTGSRVVTLVPEDVEEVTRLAAGDEAAVDLKLIVSREFQELLRNIDEILGFALRVAVWLATALYQMLLILMITAFLVVDRQKIVGFLHSVAPQRHRGLVVRLTGYIDRGLAGVIRGQLMICTVNGLLTWIGLEILDVRYALMLGFVAGVLSLIPIFGTIISTIPIVLIAWGTGGWYQALLALAWILLIHFLEANFLNPKIMGHASKIHPVVIIFALLAGEHAYGIVGALLAVPAASIVQSMFKFYVIDRQAEVEDEPVLSAT